MASMLNALLQQQPQRNPLLHHTAPAAPAAKKKTKLHVVSTMNPETDRVKIHSVHARKEDADLVHAGRVAEAYRAFRRDNYDGDKEAWAPTWTAQQVLADHQRPVAAVHTIEVDGDAPKEVSVVHEGGIREDSDWKRPHYEARVHGGDADHAEASKIAERFSRAFYHDGNESYDEDDRPEPYPGLKAANAHQRDRENMSSGSKRTGVFNVTRHAVIP